jgi:hypothetical protein
MDNLGKTPKSIDYIPPPGFTIIQGSDDSTFAVPQFLVPATHTAFEAFRGINSLEIVENQKVLFFSIFNSFKLIV